MHSLEFLRSEIKTEIQKGSAVSLITLVNSLIELAFVLRASDIHIVPEVQSLRVRFRLDGVPLPLLIHAEIISRIKILANLRTDEHQAAQDGRFKIVFPDGSIDVRVSIMPTYYGENVVMRLLADQYQEFTIDGLGFSVADKTKIIRALKNPHGMILATGPTGSGKTTTLYSLLKLLNNEGISIVTLEDPIEYSMKGINQIGINQKTGLTFANGLRSILRQDPNVIMVGEIRDEETARLAINAALTGHVLLSTIHTNNAAATLPRLIDLDVEPYLIASTVNLVISQRLVRKICSHCKKEVSVSEEELVSFTNAMSSEILRAGVFYRGEGCDHCDHSGYSGRVSLNEVLVVDPVIRNAIHQKASASEIEVEARKQGMTTMIEDGFAKAAVGITTLQEIVRTLHE